MHLIGKATQPVAPPRPIFVRAEAAVTSISYAHGTSAGDRRQGITPSAAWEKAVQQLHRHGLRKHMQIRDYQHRGMALCGQKPGSEVIRRVFWIPPGEDPRMVFGRMTRALLRLEGLDDDAVIIGSKKNQEVDF